MPGTAGSCLLKMQSGCRLDHRLGQFDVVDFDAAGSDIVSRAAARSLPIGVRP